MPLGMVVSHVLDSNYMIAPLRFVQGLVYAIFGQRPRMSLESSTLMSLFEGPKEVMSLVIFGLRWRQCSEAPTVLLYRFMIDATYLYHRDSDSQSASPYSYVPFYIQQTVNQLDIEFHENAMGPMYQCFRSLLYSASNQGNHYVTPLLYDRLLYSRALIA